MLTGSRFMLLLALFLQASHPMCDLRAFYLPASRLLNTAPLLEKEWDFGPQALIPNISDPFLQDRSCPWIKDDLDT